LEEQFKGRGVVAKGQMRPRHDSIVAVDWFFCSSARWVVLKRAAIHSNWRQRIRDGERNRFGPTVFS
jgi:hypothetical protein